ncbi:hypothetical protein [Yinghuangia seranimata]|uniref:hypothetical protein n=1 Tax=Yinghuangia seranimata TaxID=408067 RepID=UPI00248C5165|nr:hypothetical protein [Yinghuangia seranimata]MDI2129837.1 hypothetical protein [Yinghuangia seranimata]
MKRWPAALVLAFGITVGAGGAQTAVASAQHAPACAADASPGHTRRHLPDAEIFATDNTAVITDPADPRLTTELYRFACEVRSVVRASGADPERSSLLDGVFWSGDLGTTTYERSREFDVDDVDAAELRAVAETVRARYHQESVLTFEYLPESAPRATAIEIEVPGVDVKTLHDGLASDAEARERLYGGSVTVRGGSLLLVADRADADLVRRFVTVLGGSWDQAKVRYGAREFVG